MDTARLTHLQARTMGPLTRAGGRLQARVYRRFGGRVMGRFLGKPVLVLTTTGRRSGRPRSTPVVYMRDGDRWVVIPSNAGLDRAPAWWLNLQADPEAEIEVDGRRHRVGARAVEGEERDRMWSEATRYNPAFREYQKFTSREIPIVVLEKR